MLLRGQYIYHPLGLDSKNNIIFGRFYENTDGRTITSTIGISNENVVFCEDTYNVGITTLDQGEVFGVYIGWDPSRPLIYTISRQITTSNSVSLQCYAIYRDDNDRVVVETLSMNPTMNQVTQKITMIGWTVRK